MDDDNRKERVGRLLALCNYDLYGHDLKIPNFAMVYDIAMLSPYCSELANRWSLVYNPP